MEGIKVKHKYQLSTPVHLEPPPTTVPPPPVSPEKRKCSPIVPKLLPQLLHTATTPPHTFLSGKSRRKHPKSAVVIFHRRPLPPLHSRRSRPSPTQPSTPSCSESSRDQTPTKIQTGRCRKMVRRHHSHREPSSRLSVSLLVIFREINLGLL